MVIILSDCLGDRDGGRKRKPGGRPKSLRMMNLREIAGDGGESIKEVKENRIVNGGNAIQLSVGFCLHQPHQVAQCNLHGTFWGGELPVSKHRLTHHILLYLLLCLRKLTKCFTDVNL